jgi:predicted phage tail protein
MRTVKLYGHLGKQFGRSIKLDVHSPAEAVRALRANFPDFEHALVGHKLGYHVYVGNEAATVDTLTFQSANSVIKFVPVVAGAKDAGIGQIIVGAILVVVGMVATAYGFGAVGVPLTQAGYAMMVGGVVTMLIGAPKTPGPANGPNNMPNYSFNGPVNTIAQGNSVPVCYGRLIVGSQVISANLSVEQTTGRIVPPTPGVIT